MSSIKDNWLETKRHMAFTVREFLKCLLFLFFHSVLYGQQHEVKQRENRGDYFSGQNVAGSK